MRRLEAEREERERRRQESELQAIKDRNFKEKMQQISQTAHGQKVLKKLNEDVCIFKFNSILSFDFNFKKYYLGRDCDINNLFDGFFFSNTYVIYTNSYYTYLYIFFR